MFPSLLPRPSGACIESHYLELLNVSPVLEMTFIVGYKAFHGYVWEPDFHIYKLNCLNLNLITVFYLLYKHNIVVRVIFYTNQTHKTLKLQQLLNSLVLDFSFLIRSFSLFLIYRNQMQIFLHTENPE